MSKQAYIVLVSCETGNLNELVELGKRVLFSFVSGTPPVR